MVATHSREDDALPFPGQRHIVYALEIAALAAFSIYILAHLASFLSRISGFIGILLGAIFFANAIRPAVVRLEARYSRKIAIAVVYVALVIFLAAGVSIVVPVVADSISQIGGTFPVAVASYHNQVAAMPWLARLPAHLRDNIIHGPELLAAAVGQLSAGTAGKLVQVGLSAASLAALIIVVPALAVYLLLEEATLRRAGLRLTPPSWRLTAARLGREIDAMIGGFIRGQLIVAVCVGAMVTALLLALHVRYALLIGIMAGIFDIVPYVGAIAGWLPAVTVALMTNGWVNALLVTVGIIIINQVEGNVLVPRIISEHVGLSPLAVIAALFIGAELLGVFGLLIAVPVVAALRIIGEKLVDETLPTPTASSASAGPQSRS